MKTTAIVLAGGSGSRMKTKTKKQYLLLEEKPVLWYSLHAFEASPLIDEVILVCGAGEEETCREQFVGTFGFHKIRAVVAGGKERYHSVYAGLKMTEGSDYVLIHDGARPFIDGAMLERIMECLKEYPACVVGMPVKDTIKMSTEDGCVAQTLPREQLWMIQTPQAFSCPLIKEAYEKLICLEKEGYLEVKITDDAMVAEYMSQTQVHLIEGSYNNIKITTPEDLVFAEAIVRKMYQ